MIDYKFTLIIDITLDMSAKAESLEEAKKKCLDYVSKNLEGLYKHNNLKYVIEVKERIDE